MRRAPACRACSGCGLRTDARCRRGLRNTGLTSLPSEIGTLTGLEVLYVDGNAALASIPTEIAALDDLRAVRLNGNALSNIGTEFRGFSPTETCRFDDNPNLDCQDLQAGTTCCTVQNCGSSAACFK